MTKLLCLGAFANGNIGDMYQADAIARLIKSVQSDADVHSVSPSRRNAPYPAQAHRPAKEGAAFDPDYINGFDMLFVGGGGLLASPHTPLNDKAWVEAITIPICAISLGAAGNAPNMSRIFIERCHRFSVRDAFSYEAVKHIRPDASIIMDPILLDTIAKPRPASCRQAGITWVPGKLVLGTEEIWSKAIERTFDRQQDHILSFNPVTDRNSGFEWIFDDVDYLDSVDRFLARAASSQLVVSERYHACIYALASGVAAVGICLRSAPATSKIEALYRTLGIEHALVHMPFADSRQALLAMADQIDLAGIGARLLSERRSLIDYLAECLRSV
jgi:polysaccharide pyruvyl transferase WcaK-like protein